MRFFEIAEPRPFIIERTTRFVKEFEKLSRAYPQIVGVLERFISFKIQHHHTPINKRDTPFTGGVLGGLAWHFHLVATRVILIYKVEGNKLRLLAVVDHSGYGASAETALRKYILSLTDADFKTFEIEPEKTQTTLTPEEQKALSEEFYGWAAKNPEEFKAQSPSHLLEIAALATDRPVADIIATFGGENGFMQYVAGIIKSLGL